MVNQWETIAKCAEQGWIEHYEDENKQMDIVFIHNEFEDIGLMCIDQTTSEMHFYALNGPDVHVKWQFISRIVICLMKQMFGG